jgi:alpha-glucosidase (family GH31 glycosyl hydrolase)
VAIAAAGLLAAAPAGARADERVASGPLAATIGTDPWHLSFAQAGGAGLDESAVRVGGPTAALGFAGVAGWQHATRVLRTRPDGDAMVLDVATTDPAGRRLTVVLRPGGDGVISLSAAVAGGPDVDVTAMGIGFESPRSEHFLGFGERSDRVDQRGRDVENYVSDGPFSRNTRPFVAATIPPQGLRARDDATYYPVPWLLSSRGYGVLLDNDETSTFHLATALGGEAWSAEVQARTLSLRVFAGPTPAGALARFTAATGRQPPPGAPWAYGPWFQTGQPNVVPIEDEAAALRKLQDADAPVSVAETQLRYLPCGLDRGNEDYERRRVESLHSRGVAVLTYVNPMLCTTYSPLFGQAAGAGALVRTALGTPALFTSFVGGIGPLGFAVVPSATFDFSSAAGRSLYAGVLKRMVAAGHDGWMEDFGEYTPLEGVSGGRSGSALHNHYPVDYHCAVAGIVDGGLSGRPLVRFQRSGWTGAARCASDVWGGDPTTGFGFDGLSSAVKQALSIGLSGVSRWGSDIGGYDTIADDPRLTPELLKRWIEFGAVSGVMRTKRSGLAIPSYERPQIWDPGIVEVWRRYAKLHTQLYPYLAGADASYRETGMPLMRQLALLDPGDPRSAEVEDELGFGPALLAAPVVRAGAARRDVWLPRGRWLDGADALRYDAGDGAYHVGRARAGAGGPAVSGRRVVSADAPVDVLPLYLRAGALLALLPADVATLSDYSGGGVRLADRRSRLHLLAWPSGRSTARLYEHDRITSHATRRRWRLAFRTDRTLRVELEASTAMLGFRPCRVTLGSRTLPRRAWRFDRAGRILHVRFRARRATLGVRGC